MLLTSATPSKSTERKTFRKTDRILKRVDFKRVEGMRYRATGAYVIVFVRPNENGRRLGITVTKHVGNAVCRNWWKRRIREVYRNRPEAFSGLDTVVIVKRALKEQPPLAAIERDLLRTVVRSSRLARAREMERSKTQQPDCARMTDEA